jgi:hydroxypyruvate reductase
MSGEDEAFRNSVFELLLSSHDLVENARSLAEKAGYYVAVDNSCDDWDYADAARYLLERFHSLRSAHPRLCLISGGEVTVTMDRTPGAGGRNQQFVLACALELANHPGERLTVFSAGSDGIDGNTRSAGSQEVAGILQCLSAVHRSGRLRGHWSDRPQFARPAPAAGRQRLNRDALG